MGETDELEEFAGDDEPLSETFDNQVEGFDDDEAAIDAEFAETRTGPAADDDDVDALKGEVVEEKTDLDLFLESIPANTEVAIVVHRKPDHNLKFRIPNVTDGHIETRIWGREKLDDVYTDIQHTHGGGRYRFQVRVGAGGGRKGGFSRAWEQTIFDPAEPSVRERTLNAAKAKPEEQERNYAPSPQFAPAAPVDEEEQFEKMLSKMERLQSLFDRLRPEPPAEAQQYSVKDQIILEAMRKAPNGDELNAQVVKKAMSLVAEEKKTWIDLAMYGLEHSEQIFKLAGTAINIVGPFIFGKGPLPPNMTMTMPPMPPTFNMPMPAAPPQPPQQSPLSDLKMPDKAPVAEPGTETQPATAERPASGIKKVEW